ncbi:MAG: rubrerythrin [Clostridiales bacterium]|nr:rubrerythrin [Clostridiales bacterium]
MAYYDYLNIPNEPAVPGMNYWNGYDYYNTAGEMPHPPRPPKPEPPPVVCPQPKEDYYTYPANLDDALKLIEKAVMGEAHDIKFYEILMKLCGKDDKDLFEKIIADERKHAQLFRTIYCELTGHVLPDAPGEKVIPPKSCCEGIEMAILDELDAVVKYRRILYAMQDRRHINMMVEIITDEQKHAQKLNLLCCKNDCANECKPPKK